MARRVSRVDASQHALQRLSSKLPFGTFIPAQPQFNPNNHFNTGAPAGQVTMASNFFSNKARAAAAATSGGSKNKSTDAKDEQARHQPWVEK